MDKWQKILKEYWGYDDFRGIQREIIESIGAGRDTLGLMPTGGGKSITFQVPALAMEGVCIVITPLIALMKDQVQHLRERGIKASAIYSGMTRNEIITTLENSIFGGVKILYVSPERLSSELFLAKVKRINISFITVDGAHCISQWGYDFRPAYLKIANIRRIFPDVPVLALTATATPVVVDDIIEKLELKGEDNVFRMSFERKNLAYIVRHTNDKYGELIHILNSVKGCSIIYVRSRRRTKEIAQLLNANNIKATFFHAGLDNAVKDDRQKAWQSDEVRVIVRPMRSAWVSTNQTSDWSSTSTAPTPSRPIFRRQAVPVVMAKRLTPYCSIMEATDGSCQNALPTTSRKRTILKRYIVSSPISTR